MKIEVVATTFHTAKRTLEPGTNFFEGTPNHVIGCFRREKEQARITSEMREVLKGIVNIRLSRNVVTLCQPAILKEGIKSYFLDVTTGAVNGRKLGSTLNPVYYESDKPVMYIVRKDADPSIEEVRQAAA